MLACCYRNSLALAADNGLKSIAFPAISAGAFCYPRDQAARVASETIEAVLAGMTAIERVDLVFYEMQDARSFLKNHNFR
jgi:O-acetyl-ADP-ribose deacetylase (regulator of RNase III)